MSTRYTRKDAEDAFTRFVSLIGGRVATGYAATKAIEAYQ